jgi:GTP cyclohydrolase IA
MNNAIKRSTETTEDINLSIATDEIQSDESEKIEKIQFHFRQIMETLGLDLTDDSLKDTPARVAKMYVKEIFQGLNAEAFPEITLFSNSYGYTDALIERDIEVYSYCEHHFVPFIGRAHVAYIPKDKVIGLSKLNRIVKYFARRPQVQERLTNDIATSLKCILSTDDVAVYIEARHLCVASRGVEDTGSATVTTHFSGRFSEDGERFRFYSSIRS